MFQSHPNATVADQSACNGSGVSHCRVYSLDLAYDTIHNILTKNQLDTRYPPGGGGVLQKKTSYNFGYTYGLSGPTSVRPHAPTRIADRTFSYDANGNQTGWEHLQNGTRRTIVWDDENRIQSLFDNGHEKTYRYDDQGTRFAAGTQPTSARIKSPAGRGPRPKDQTGRAEIASTGPLNAGASSGEPSRARFALLSENGFERLPERLLVVLLELAERPQDERGLDRCEHGLD